jgi:hypothetical protein
VKRPKKWKFRLGNDTLVNLKKHIGEVKDFIFVDYVNGQLEIVGFIVDGWLTIIKGYEWDGCTPKVFRLFGHWIGVPDFPRTKRASMVHDFLIEYCIQHSIPRKQIDVLFDKILAEDGFILRPIYSNSVHLFRPFALKLGNCPQ